MTRFCIICGASENAVEKLFCFPKNVDRCCEWQRRLGIVQKHPLNYQTRICNRHFSSDSFAPLTSTLKLKRDAVPILVEPFPDQGTTLQQQISTTAPSSLQPSSSELSQNDDVHIETDPNISTQPSTSRRCVRRPLFKNADGSANVSPTRSALMANIRKKEGQIRKLKVLCKTRGTEIKKLVNLEEVVKLQPSKIFKGMSFTTANFLISQIRCSKRSPRGRRWTEDDKIVALTIYKRSPRCYNLLRKFLALPSKQTLVTLMQKIPFEVGINLHIFKHLGECLNKFPENELLCSLAFDEMSIREHLQYNCSTDCFEGVEDFGKERTSQLANYALVFMAQGVTRSWKQPLAYYFSKGGVDSKRLETLLKEVLHAMHLYDVSVIATICDTASANVRTLKNMGCSEDRLFFNFEGHSIYTFYDTPHLLKSTRNLFKKYNVQVPTCEILSSCEGGNLQARWSDIVRTYDHDKNTPLIFRMMYKIKDYYLAPLRQNAMKVKIAAQTLSRTTAACIYQAVAQGVLPLRGLATAKWISDIDELFDSCNGSSIRPSDGKPYKCAVTKDSKHIEFWTESREKVQNWRFMRNQSNVDNVRFWKPPTQSGWIHTLQAFVMIWSDLKNREITSVKPRCINQDAFENLFGAICSGCGCNENPTVTQFVGSLKTQIINSMQDTNLSETNCEEDDLALLNNLRQFLSLQTTPDETISPAEVILEDSSPLRIAEDTSGT